MMKKYTGFYKLTLFIAVIFASLNTEGIDFAQALLDADQAVQVANDNWAMASARLAVLNDLLRSSYMITQEDRAAIQGAVDQQQQELTRAEDFLDSLMARTEALKSRFASFQGLQLSIQQRKDQLITSATADLNNLHKLFYDSITDLAAEAAASSQGIYDFGIGVGGLVQLSGVTSLTTVYNQQVTKLTNLKKIFNDANDLAAQLDKFLHLYQNIIPDLVAKETTSLEIQEKWLMRINDLLGQFQTQLDRARTDFNDKVTRLQNKAAQVAAATAQERAEILGEFATSKATYSSLVDTMTLQTTVIQKAYDSLKKLISSSFDPATQTSGDDLLKSSKDALVGIESAFSDATVLHAELTEQIAHDKAVLPLETAAFEQEWLTKWAWILQQRLKFEDYQRTYDSLSANWNTLKADYQKAQTTEQERVKKRDAFAADIKKQSAVLADVIKTLSDKTASLGDMMKALQAAIDAAKTDDDMVKVVAQAGDLTTILTDLAVPQHQFSDTYADTNNTISAAKTYVRDDEMATIQQPIVDQVKWFTDFSKSVDAYRTQNSQLRAALEKKKADLGSAKAAAENATRAAQRNTDIGALVDALNTQITALTSKEVEPFIKTTVSNVGQLTADLTATSSSITQDLLAALQSRLDGLVADTAELGKLIDDVTLFVDCANLTVSFGKKVLAKDDTALGKVTALSDFLGTQQIWSAAARKTKNDLANTHLPALKQRLVDLQKTLNAEKGFAYQFDASNKQLDAVVDANKSLVPDLVAKAKELEGAISQLSASTGADYLSDSITALLTAATAADDQLKDVRAVVDRYNADLGKSDVPPAVVTKYNPHLKEQATWLDSAVKDLNTAKSSINDLKTKLANKKSDLAIKEAAQAQQDAKAYAALTTKNPTPTSTDVKSIGAQQQVPSTSFAGALDALTNNITNQGDALVVLQKTKDELTDRIEKITQAADVLAFGKDFSTAKNTLIGQKAAVDKMNTDMILAQKLMDTEQSAGRYVALDAGNKLSVLKDKVASFAADLDGVSKAFDAIQKKYDTRKAAADALQKDIDALKTVIAGLANKIKTASTALDGLKSTYDSASSSYTAMQSSAEGDQLVATIDQATQRNNSIVAAINTANSAVPSVDTALNDFRKKNTTVPADIEQSVNDQKTWIKGASDVRANYIKSLGTLRDQIAEKQKQLATTEQSGIGQLSYADQLKRLEDAAPNVRQAYDVVGYMRNLTYTFENRYGDKAADKNASILEMNKARLIRLIDWLRKNLRFASVRDILDGYANQLAGGTASTTKASNLIQATNTVTKASSAQPSVSGAAVATTPVARQASVPRAVQQTAPAPVQSTAAVAATQAAQATTRSTALNLLAASVQPQSSVQRSGGTVAPATPSQQIAVTDLVQAIRQRQSARR